MIDFLFSNPIIIIILIGVISSLLKKKNNKENQPKTGQPQAPKPIWKEIVQEFQDAFEEEKNKVPKTIQEAKHIRQPDKEAEGKRVAELKRLQQEYDEKHHLEEEPKVPSSTVFPVSATPKGIPVATMNTISDKKSPIYNKDISFGKQELINGIIMSEVLGPPRSKRRLK